MNKTIEFIDLKTQYARHKAEIDRRIQQVLDHGQYIMGPEVAELETALCAYTGAKYCITVASGTEALLISLMALDIKPGDEVITTPFTFAATAEVIALLGAVPVFVDIEPDTCNLDAGLIEAAISDKTRAIIPVSLYGQVADMDEINAIADRYGIAVIEDAAQSFGAEYQGRKSGHLSTFGCISFFPSKPLGCYGDGGAIFCDDDALAQACREIRVHGQSRRYHHTRIGVGGRMDTLQCAVVLAKLAHFTWEIDRRIAIGQHYLHLLREAADAGIHPLALRADRSCVWAQFTVQADFRERVLQKLQQAQIPVAIHYPESLHLQPAYRHLCRISGTLPCAEMAAKRVLSVPMHPYLEQAEQARIIAALVG